MLQLILPKTQSEILHPPLFLAGPIRGGGNWQEAACDYLISKDIDVSVAVPCRWPDEHRLSNYQTEGEADAFPRQAIWERYYLDQASIQGSIVFWLPCQSTEHPRQDGQPYARDTYGELGAWRTKVAYEPHRRVTIGAEPDFPGLDVIRCNLDEDTGTEFLIHSTLEATLEAALQRAVQ